MISWDQKQPVDPGTQDRSDSRVALRKFIMCVISGDNDIVKRYSAVNDVLNDILQQFSSRNAFLESVRIAEHMEIGQLKESHGFHKAEFLKQVIVREQPKKRKKKKKEARRDGQRFPFFRFAFFRFFRQSKDCV
jgi:hypothetical protein